jgi:hypothetical protein
LYPKNPTKSKIVTSEIGITCDELGRFIAIHSAKKFDVKAPEKEDSKNKKCNCCSIILFDDFLQRRQNVTLVVRVLQPELQ